MEGNYDLREKSWGMGRQFHDTMRVPAIELRRGHIRITLTSRVPRPLRLKSEAPQLAWPLPGLLTLMGDSGTQSNLLRGL